MSEAKTRTYPSEVGILWIAAVVGGLDLLLEAVSLAVRYGQSGAELDLDWRLDPAVVLPILLVAVLYAAGLWTSPPAPGARTRLWRHVSFFAGLAILFLTLESPFDEIADRLFVAHQIQHMTLSMIVPILIVLAAPQATLLRGLPRLGRRYLVRPFFGGRAFRGLRVFAYPAVAALLYIGTNYFWMAPHFHDLALENERVHDLLHGTLLLAGMIFFWRGLDPRPYPLGPALTARLFMFWLAAVSDILLGSFLAFKTVSLYHAYGPSPHLFGISAIDDECYGGLTMWIPGAGMFTMAAILTIRRMAGDEERREARGGIQRVTADSIARQRTANRKMAVGLASFAALVLLIGVMTVVVYRYALAPALPVTAARPV